MLELKREDHVRAQKDTLIFIALPFTYVPKGLEMVSFHATVVAGKEIDKKIVMPLKSCCFAHHTYCVFWCSYYHRSFIRSLLIHFTSLPFSFAVTRQVAGDFVLSPTQPRGEYEFSNVYVAVIISKKCNLGPVQTSCFCRAELIVIRFDGSTAGKQLWFRRRARVEPNSGFTDTS